MSICVVRAIQHKKTQHTVHVVVVVFISVIQSWTSNLQRCHLSLQFSSVDFVSIRVLIHRVLSSTSKIIKCSMVSLTDLSQLHSSEPILRQCVTCTNITDIQLYRDLNKSVDGHNHLRPAPVLPRFIIAWYFSLVTTPLKAEYWSDLKYYKTTSHIVPSRLSNGVSVLSIILRNQSRHRGWIVFCTQTIDRNMGCE